MTHNRWHRLEEIYDGAASLAPAERPAFLDRECAGDHELRREIEAMLAEAPAGRSLDVERRLVIETRGGEPPRDTPPDLLIGRRIGAWRIVRRIGSGGMAHVFQVEREDGSFRQVAALKIGRPSFGDADAQRFRLERQILANLNHPNIARLLDGGVTSEGQPYLVIEYVEGETLTAFCASRQLPADARIKLFQIVCAAVQHAHRNLIVHRDLKPANILVSRDGEVKLLDFGIAKLLDASSFGVSVATTREHVRPMTLEYAAPEQVAGGAITTATDVHALGVILYELLSGRRPYDASDSSEIERRITTEEASPPQLGGDLDTIVLMALRKEPDRRYSSAGQLAEDLDRQLAGRPVLAQRDTVRYRTRRFVARHRWSVAAAALVLLVLTAFAIVTAIQARRLAVERDAANTERQRAEQVLAALTEMFRVTDPSVTPASAALPMTDLLRRGEELAQRQVENQPEARARLAHALGRIHAARSEYDRARALFEDALASRRSQPDANEAVTVEIAHDLAVLLGQMGQTDKAESLLRASLADHRRLYGSRHDRVAQALQDLGDIIEAKESRVSLWGEALAMRQALHAGDHPEVAWAMSRLSSHMLALGRAPQALVIARDAVAMLYRTVGERHPRHLEALGELTQVLNQNNRLDESEAIQRRLLAIQREVFGTQSFQVAESLNSLGVNLITQGNYAAGEPVMAESFAVHSAVFGEAHWRTANTARNAGRNFELQRRYAEAEAWLMRAAELYERAEGRVTQSTHYIRGQAGLVMLRRGRMAEAERVVRNAMVGVEADAAGAGESRVADMRLLMGRVLVERNQPARAEPLLRQVVTLRDRLLGPQHPRAAEARCELARALAAEGRRTEAATLLDSCVTIYETWGLADPVVVASLHQLMAKPPR